MFHSLNKTDETVTAKMEHAVTVLPCKDNFFPRLCQHLYLAIIGGDIKKKHGFPLVIANIIERKT